MRILFSIFLAAILVSCKPSPINNPFDKIFDIDIDELLNAGWERPISTQCGYARVSAPEGRFRLFYQVFDEELKFITETNWGNPPIVAKGFEYTIDTLKINEHKLDSILDNKDSLIQTPIDTGDFNLHLNPFGFHVIEYVNDSIIITNDEKKDSISLGISIYHLWDGLIVRQIEYYNFKNSSSQ